MSTSPLPKNGVVNGSGAMFDQIAQSYDFVNRVISFGTDVRWRKRAVEALRLGDGPTRVLDVATGTGDLAIQIARTHEHAHVTGVDPSERMLEVGRTKVISAELDARVELLAGDAEALAFADNTFDGVCISFGIRNVPDRARALREFARVTRPGGRIVILELGEPEGAFIGPIARFHVHEVVPMIGALLSGAREYRYLERSIAAFPPRPAFLQLMQDAHITGAHVDLLTFGAASLFVGEKALAP